MKRFEAVVEAGGSLTYNCQLQGDAENVRNDYVACDSLFPRACTGEVKNVP